MSKPKRSVPVRLKDIAAKLGVSTVTVSLALNNHPRISEKRRKEVRAAAVELGYRPNAMAAALAHHKWSEAPRATSGACLAWLNFWSQPDELRGFKEFDGYWRGAARAAEARGYRLEEFIGAGERAGEQLGRILNSRNIRGILIPPQRTQLDMKGLDWNHFAAIRFGRSLEEPKVSLVSNNQTVDVRDAVERMAALGYRRIGYITSSGMLKVTLLDTGYLKAQIGMPASARLPMLVLPHDTVSKKIAILSSWVRRHRPDAILTTEGDLCALLTQAGWRVPEDIGLAATSLVDCDADSGINQNAEEIGKVAAEAVISLIQHGNLGLPDFCQEILVRGQWVQGRMLPGPLKAARKRTSTPHPVP